MSWLRNDGQQVDNAFSRVIALRSFPRGRQMIARIRRVPMARTILLKCTVYKCFSKVGVFFRVVFQKWVAHVVVYIVRSIYRHLSMVTVRLCGEAYASRRLTCLRQIRLHMMQRGRASQSVFASYKLR